MMPPPPPSTNFDEYAARYDDALHRGLQLTGENRDYFARRRVEWLGRRLSERGLASHRVLDFGCGDGTGTRWLRQLNGATQVVGVDVSEESLARAREQWTEADLEFYRPEDVTDLASFDLVFCNGVFHHLPPEQRPETVTWLRNHLFPGGSFAFWENNPWNLGTRWIMRRVPFDRDAQMLSAPAARRLLVAGGFTVLGTDFQFVFPRCLRWLRGWETLLARWPLGGQYLVLARRPA